MIERETRCFARSPGTAANITFTYTSAPFTSHYISIEKTSTRRKERRREGGREGWIGEMDERGKKKGESREEEMLQLERPEGDGQITY